MLKDIISSNNPIVNDVRGHYVEGVKSAVDFWGMPDHIKKLECNFYKVQCSALIVSKIGETNKTTGAKVNSRLDPSSFPHHFSSHDPSSFEFLRVWGRIEVEGKNHKNASNSAYRHDDRHRRLADHP